MSKVRALVVGHWLLRVTPRRWASPDIELHCLAGCDPGDPPLRVWAAVLRVMRVVAHGRSWRCVRVHLRFKPSAGLYLRLDAAGLRLYVGGSP